MRVVLRPRVESVKAKVEWFMNQRYSSSRKPWWKDSAMISDIIIFIAALVAISLSVIDALDLWDIQWFTDRLSQITVALVSALILFSVVERHFLINRWQVSLLKEIRESRVGPYQGLTSVYSNRDHLPRFPEWVEGATEEVFISGVNLAYIALHQTITLEAKATSGCNIKLLLVDPGTEDQPNPLLEPWQKTFADPQTGELLKTNLRRLSHWKSQLPTAARGRIEIWTTRSVPTHSVTFLDKHLPSGKLLLMMITPKTDERWGVLIENGRGGELYSRYVKAYEELWDEAQPWD